MVSVKGGESNWCDTEAYFAKQTQILKFGVPMTMNGYEGIVVVDFFSPEGDYLLACIGILTKLGLSCRIPDGYHYTREEEVTVRKPSI